MYKVIKDKGHNTNVVLENMETSATLNLGRATTEILGILYEAGYKLAHEGGDLKLIDPWNLEVNSEVAGKLQATAFKMSRPVRAKVSKTPTTKEIKKEANKRIDAMDVLLGLANYV